ncbi:hypothetical protein P8C59_003373 [Phyllachora maydis]|nr:hypothetical protein P8C59_003373 [Phyllachora maydis]
MPLTVLKVRFESSLHQQHASLPAAARALWRHDGGLRAFFAGSGATTLRDAPSAGLYVLFYEQAKQHLGAVVPSGGAAAVAAVHFAAALAAAGACCLVSNPLDVAKTRIQLRPGQYRGTAHALRRVVAEGGVRALGAGLVLRGVRKGLSSAVAWTVYEELVRRIGTSR